MRLLSISVVNGSDRQPGNPAGACPPQPAGVRRDPKVSIPRSSDAHPAPGIVLLQVHCAYRYHRIDLTISGHVVLMVDGSTIEETLVYEAGAGVAVASVASRRACRSRTAASCPRSAEWTAGTTCSTTSTPISTPFLPCWPRRLCRATARPAESRRGWLARSILHRRRTRTRLDRRRHRPGLRRESRHRLRLRRRPVAPAPRRCHW